MGEDKEETNLTGRITDGSLNNKNWIESQHYLVKRKYPSGSTFLNPNEVGRGTRNLEDDLQRCGYREDEIDLNGFVVLDD